MILDDFETKMGHNCVLGNVTNMLRYYHINVYEEDLYFWFCPFRGKKNLYECFLSLYIENEKGNWWQLISENLISKHPVLVGINPKYLPYTDLEVGDSTLNHYFTVIGMDKEKKQVYVSDSYIPTYRPSIFEGWIDFQEVEQGIEHCWIMNEQLLLFFRNECSADKIQNFTYGMVAYRLGEILQELHFLEGRCERWRLCIENRDYDAAFRRLAGLKLNLINPLIFLVDVLKRKTEYNKICKKLDDFIRYRWEKINVQFIKFAIAHKKLDSLLISQELSDILNEEKSLLKNVYDILICEGFKGFEGPVPSIYQMKG